MRFENYWREGEPYFDSIQIIDFPTETAKINALLGGQLDAVTDVPFGQIPLIEGRDNLALYETESGGWTPITMRVDAEPFKDVRVRQAFRLIANREEMVNQGSPATAASRTTSTRRSILATPGTIFLNASRTSTRPSPSSAPPARTA